MQDTNWLKLSQEFVFWSVVIVLALILSSYVWLFLPLTYAILAAPLVLFSVRYGQKMGISLILAISLLLSLLFERKLGMTFAAEFGVLSQALVFGFSKKYSTGKIILTSFIATTAAVILLAAGTNLVTQNGSLTTAIEQEIEQNASKFLEAYDSAEIDQKEKKALEHGIEMAKAFLLKAYLGVYASITLLFVVGNCLVSKWLLLRSGYEIADTIPFIELVLPEELVWGFIGSASLLAITLFSATNSTPIHIIGLNLTLIFATFYLVQGWAIVIFWGQRSKLPTALKLFGLFFIVVQPFFILLITGLGLFDIWFDFRKLQGVVDD